MALGMTLRELDERMPPQEFAVWMDYFRREPYGEYGHYYRAARQVISIHNGSITKRSDAIRNVGEVFEHVFAPTPEEAARHQAELDAAAADPADGRTALAGLAGLLGAKKREGYNAKSEAISQKDDD